MSSPVKLSRRRGKPAAREALTLRGGFSVDVDVLLLALRLEAAGCPLLLDAEGHLQSIPPTTIPQVDRRLVSLRWAALAALVGYVVGLAGERGVAKSESGAVETAPASNTHKDEIKRTSTPDGCRRSVGLVQVVLKSTDREQ